MFKSLINLNYLVFELTKPKCYKWLLYFRSSQVISKHLLCSKSGRNWKQIQKLWIFRPSYELIEPHIGHSWSLPGFQIQTPICVCCMASSAIHFVLNNRLVRVSGWTLLMAHSSSLLAGLTSLHLTRVWLWAQGRAGGILIPVNTSPSLLTLSSLLSPLIYC